MTRVALITTTINVPTVLTQWVKTGMTEDDIIVVTGDLRSPHTEIMRVLTEIFETTGIDAIYLHPETQQERYPELSNAIGWNCIQRRNISLLEAMKHAPEYILTIDDDNAPTSSRQVEQLIEIMQGHDDVTPAVSTDTGWYNPGRHCVTNDLRTVTHRGFPLSQRHVKPLMTYGNPPPQIGVAAMLWTGDPDIDAIERMVNAPNVARVDGNVILAPGTWAPFNTQATMFLGELAPAMFMWPHVGRYDDIWASYVTRKVMDQLGMGTYYGRPAVHQARNEHNLLADLNAELFGMQYNEQVIEAIRNAQVREEDTVFGHFVEILIDVMDNVTSIPSNTHAAFKAWIDEVERING